MPFPLPNQTVFVSRYSLSILAHYSADSSPAFNPLPHSDTARHNTFKLQNGYFFSEISPSNIHILKLEYMIVQLI